jgi:hypothetical protein
MIMAEPIAEYTVRDFSAVDTQIEQIAERERVVTQKLRLANLFQLVKFAVIGLVTLGVFFLLLGIAYRIAFPPEQKVIETKEVLSSNESNTAPQTIVIQTPTGSVINPGSNNGAIVVEGASTSAPATSSKESSSAPSNTMWGATETAETTNSSTIKTEKVNPDEIDKKSSDLSALGKRRVTTFTFMESNINGFSEVTTGWNWGDVDAKTPNRQFCYINKSKKNGVKETVDLGERLNTTKNPKNLFTNNRGKAAGLSKTQWNSLFRKCSWFK